MRYLSEFFWHRHLPPFGAWLLAALVLFAPASPTAAAAQDVRVELQSGHTDRVIGLFFRPDGRTMVSITHSSMIWWDVASRRVLRQAVLGRSGVPRALTVSPDGSKLAEIDGYGDASVIIRSTADGRELIRLQLQENLKNVDALAFSPNGRLLAAGGRQTKGRDYARRGSVLLWDTANWQIVRSVEPFTISRFETVNALAFAPDGSELAAGGKGETALVDVRTGEVRRTLVDPTKEDSRSILAPVGRVRALAYAPEGLLVTGKDDGHVRVWAPGSPTPVSTWQATQKELGVQSIAVLPGGRLLVRSSDDAQVWELASGRKLHSFEGQLQPWTTVASRDGTLVVAGKDESVVSWDANGRSLAPFVSHGSALTDGLLYPDAARLVTFNEARIINAEDRFNEAPRYRATVWDVRAGRAISSVTRDGSPEVVAFRQGGLRVLRVLDDPETTKTTKGSREVRFTLYEDWDEEEGVKRSSLTLPATAALNPETVSPDGTLVAGTPLLVWGAQQQAGPAMLVYDLVGRKLASLPLEKARSERCSQWSPRSTVLAICEGSRVLLWNPRSGQAARKLEGHRAAITKVAFAPDGNTLISGDEAGHLKRWDVDTGAVLASFAGPAAAHAWSVSSDGRWLAASSLTEGTSLWSLADPQRPPRLLGGPANGIGFSDDGQTVYGTGVDKSLHLWRMSDGFELARFVPIGQEDWIVFTPEGYFNASSFAAAEAMNVYHGDRVYAVSDFWDVFYRPDLVRKRLAGQELQADTGGLTFASALRSPPPREVNFALDNPVESARSARVRVRFTVADAGGGIGELRLFHNGKLVASEPATGGASASLCRVRTGASCEGEAVIDAIPGADNELSLTAFNAANTMQGPAARLSFTSGLPKREPRLWLVAVGINRFDSGQQGFGALANAGKDAEDFLRVYATRASTLFKPENIRVVGAGTGGSDALRDEQATKAAILAALDRVAAEARPEDSFVWFVASHGTTNQAGLFGVVPHDVRCADAACRNPGNLVDAHDILSRTKTIRARLQLLILDTCQSGALDQQISGFYDARMATLARQSGIHLFASAQATEHASDSDGQGNGLFTGQLLRGLQQPEADRNGDSLVSIVELGTYARRQTVEASGSGQRGAKLVGAVAPTTQQRKSQQTPLIMNFGQDQALVRLPETQRKRP